jgi:SAM-dependent methyltransferase
MDGSWDSVITLLQEQRYQDVVADLDAALRDDPTNVEAFLLRSVAKSSLEKSSLEKSSLGLTRNAEADLWRALVVDPAAQGVRSAMGDLFVQDLTLPNEGRDFALESGERQIGHAISEIRRDHSARYEFAAHWLGRNLESAQDSTGLDLFCGNGYGARILADRCGARIVGVDGSAPAVAFAEHTFGDHRVLFRHAYFPFRLAPASADFAVCFESIEHVDDCDEFLRQVGAATAGPILLSFPLETSLPFALNKDRFRFHVRHFSIDEMADKLLHLTGRRIVETRGQTVYHLKDGLLAGLLDLSRMELSRLSNESQFALVIAV